MINIDHTALIIAMHEHDVRNCPDPKPKLSERPRFVQQYYVEMAKVVCLNIAEQLAAHISNPAIREDAFNEILTKRYEANH